MMGVNARNMYSCLQKCNKLNKTHLVGQLLNSIHDARTHVYTRKIATACYSLPQHQSALGTNTVASQWLCNIASGDNGKYRITGKGICLFYTYCIYECLLPHVCNQHIHISRNCCHIYCK